MARSRSKLRRDHQLNFSLTGDELTGLRCRAAAAGMHLVDYGRSLLLQRVSNVRRSAPERTEAVHALTHAARLLVIELRRLGNNLNQIAHRLHGRGEPVPPTLEPLLREIRALLHRGAKS